MITLSALLSLTQVNALSISSETVTLVSNLYCVHIASRTNFNFAESEHMSDRCDDMPLQETKCPTIINLYTFPGRLHTRPPQKHTKILNAYCKREDRAIQALNCWSPCIKIMCNTTEPEINANSKSSLSDLRQKHAATATSRNCNCFVEEL